jgi:hypothetical protein
MHSKAGPAFEPFDSFAARRQAPTRRGSRLSVWNKPAPYSSIHRDRVSVACFFVASMLADCGWSREVNEGP